MLEVIMIIWTISPTGAIDRLVIPGWYEMERCEAAIEVLVAENPHDQWSPQIAARCMEVPK